MRIRPRSPLRDPVNFYRVRSISPVDPTVRLTSGDVVGGDTVAQVLESRHPEHRPGEFVVVRNGWQQYALSSGQGVRRLDSNSAPISTALGVLGLPGLLGYTGMIYVGEPRPGQTVLVSDATGRSRIHCRSGGVHCWRSRGRYRELTGEVPIRGRTTGVRGVYQ